MTIAVARKHPFMNLPEFLCFLHSRPDEERWELIEGVPMMMPPPRIAHQRIASNLERHLLQCVAEAEAAVARRPGDRTRSRPPRALPPGTGDRSGR